MRAGFALVDITPPAGVELTGFVAREGPSTGVHDRLFARALVFEDGGSRAAIVAVDLIGLGRNLVARLRERVTGITGIRPSHQLFACTHTHGGPETGVLTSIAAPDFPYLRRLEASLSGVVAEAAADLRPASLGYGRGESAMGQNRLLARLGLEGPIDSTVAVLRVDDRSSRPLATLVNYGCHATAAGPVLLVNADYPGRLTTVLEEAGCGPTLFVNGAGADVNPRLPDRRGIAEAEGAGELLASDALRVWKGIEAVGATGVQAWTAEVALPLEAPPGPAEAAAIQQSGRLLLEPPHLMSVDSRTVGITHIRYASILAELHYGRRPTRLEIDTEAQVLRIGPVTFVALPGETFSSTGRAVREMAGGPTIVCGWANDLVGYIPDETALVRGGYEVETAHRYYGLPAPFSLAARDRLLGACRTLVERLDRGQQ